MRSDQHTSPFCRSAARPQLCTVRPQRRTQTIVASVASDLNAKFGKIRLSSGTHLAPRITSSMKLRLTSITCYDLSPSACSAIPGSVSIVEGRGGLPTVVLKHSSGASAEVSRPTCTLALGSVQLDISRLLIAHLAIFLPPIPALNNFQPHHHLAPPKAPLSLPQHISSAIELP